MLAGLKVLQLPVPTTGLVALNCALVLHTSKLDDTCAADGLSLVTFTKLLALQPLSVTVHWKVLLPNCKELTVLLAALSVFTTPKPAPKVHAPV